MPEFTKPSVVGFSILRGVTDCLWSNVIKDSRMLKAVFPLLKAPHVLSSADEDTTLHIFFHSMRIGLFILVVGFIGRGEGQLLR